MISIYKITNTINGKCYIGQAVDVKRRWREHCSLASKCKKLRNAIQKYGRDAFELKVLFECEDVHASELETQLICWYGSVVNGYNICYAGGSRIGIKHTDEAKQKMSDAWSNRSDETKEKLSAMKKGRRVSEEIKIILSAKNKGENNPNSKLTDAQRDEIKALAATGEYTKVEIAKMYNISVVQIFRIIKKHK